jgi:hypothetical protein
MREPPRRLVDDPEISSSLRDELSHASEAHQADAAAYDSAGKLAGLQAALASHGGGAAGVGLLAKLALGVAAASAFMAAGAALHARLEQQRAPAAHGPAVAPPSPPPRQDSRPLQDTEPTPLARHSASPAPASEPTRRASHHGATHEVHQLARIRAYLQAGDAASALKLAERGQRELGESALWHEREALAVLALLQLDRLEQAEQRSVVLLARFPNSPFRAQLERRLRRAHED